MAKQTRDKRAIRNCNSKDGQNNGKTDKGQKSNQKLYFKGRTIQCKNRQRTKEQSETVIQRTDNTMAKQTREKRAIRNCNSKDRQNNDKIDKGEKSNQKL
jgi:hypothetical protein